MYKRQFLGLTFLTQERSWVGVLSKFPAPVFDGNDVSYPSWSQNFLLSARHSNLYEAFVSEAEIPIADIGFDLTPWVEK